MFLFLFVIVCVTCYVRILVGGRLLVKATLIFFPLLEQTELVLVSLVAVIIWCCKCVCVHNDLTPSAHTIKQYSSTGDRPKNDVRP